ncbi:MAG: site-specific integrase [Thermoplasmatota archaeon]
MTAPDPIALKNEDDRGDFSTSIPHAHVSTESPATSASDSVDISPETHSPGETRILPTEGKPLVPGVNSNGIPNAKASMGHSVVKRGHKLRGPRSMGRFPFLTQVHYLVREEKAQRYYADITLDERRRKMELVAKIVQGCSERHEISNTNPTKLTDAECAVVIGSIIRGFTKDLPKQTRCSDTSKKMIRFFEEILESSGNGAVGRLRRTKKALFPKGSSIDDIEVVSLGAWQRLLFGQWHLADPWWDIVSRTAIRLYSTTGLRVSEARTERADGIDFVTSVIYVTHPKGEGKWAKSGDPRGLNPNAISLLKDYLEVRDDELARRSVDPQTVPWLFPYFAEDGAVTGWHERIWRRMMAQVQHETGVKFNFRMLRPTYCQKAIDDGTDPTIEQGREIAIGNVSKQMGHKYTTTTEKSYGRIRKDIAFAKVSKAWKPLWDENSIRGD